MDAKLIVLSGKVSKDAIALTLPTTIGRSKNASLTIAHPLVSREHCRLFENDGLLMIKDLGSTNGTYLGGRRIAEAALPPEAEFTLGPLTFQVQYEYAGDLGAVPAPVYSDQDDASAAPPPEDDDIDLHAFDDETESASEQEIIDFLELDDEDEKTG